MMVPDGVHHQLFCIDGENSYFCNKKADDTKGSNYKIA